MIMSYQRFCIIEKRLTLRVDCILAICFWISPCCDNSLQPDISVTEILYSISSMVTTGNKIKSLYNSVFIDLRLNVRCDDNCSFV